MFAPLVPATVPVFTPPNYSAGIAINIDPILAHLGPFTITWHGLFTAIGVLAGILLAIRLAPHFGITEEVVQSGAWWAVIGGIIGARVLFVWENSGQFSAEPAKAIFGITEGGLSIYGTIVGGAIGTFLFTLRNPVSFLRLADLFAPSLILGMALGRVGDIINGEHHGALWTGHGDFISAGPGIIVRYIHPATQGYRVPQHLAVGYEMILDLVVFAGLMLLFRRRFRLGSGALFWIFLMGYSVDRLLVSPYRLDKAWLTVGGLGLRQAQVFAVLCLVIGAAGLYRALTQPVVEPELAPAGAPEEDPTSTPAAEAAPPGEVADPDVADVPAPAETPVAARPRRPASRGRAAVPAPDKPSSDS